MNPRRPDPKAVARLGAIAVIGALALILTRPPTVVGQEIPRLGGPVTDQTGVLAGQEVEIRRAIERVRDTDGVELWVLFVRTNEGLTAEAFRDEVARVNSLGGNDALFVVALEERTDQIWVSNDLSIEIGEPARISSDVAEPRLRASDFAGAAMAVAEALGEANRPSEPGGAAGGGQETADQPGDEPREPAGGTAPGPDSSPVLVALAIVLVVIGVAVLAVWLRNRLAERRTAEERDRRTGQLARDANALLIATDDSIREAGHEAGFVEALFGSTDADAYRQALATASAELKAAFAVRQRLDDDVPEDAITREQMLTEILERGRRAAGLLDEQRRRVASLRELEAKAPELLGALPSAIEAVAARVPATKAAFERLHAYAPASWASVSGNGSEAQKRIDFATAELARGRATLESNRSAAAASARKAQEAIAQANALLDAIDKLASSLDETRGRLAAAIEAASPDVERARAAVEAGEVDAAAGRNVDEAGALLAAARAEAAAARPDVVAGYGQAQRANELADAVLEGARKAEERRVREAAALEAAIRSAAQSVDRASDYITARKGGVGREARTRLAEAERHLGLANELRPSDPAHALEEARVAERYAEEAYRTANDDFDDFDLRGGWRRRRSGGDMAGAILGGMILGNILGGLGRARGGGWGGTPWGGGGGSGGGHGGGGIFGGGGGHGGGGRW